MEEILDFQWKIFRIAGVRIDDRVWKYEGFWKVLYKVGLILRLYIATASIIKAAISIDDINNFAVCWFSVVNFGHALVRDRYFIQNEQRIRQMLHRVHEIANNKLSAASTDFINDIKSAMYVSNILYRMRLSGEIIIVIITTVIIFINSYIGSPVKYLCTTWPFEPIEVMEIISMALLHAVSISFTAAARSSQEGVMLSLMLIQTAEARWLGSQLNNIFSQDQGKIQRDYRNWIKLHQSFLRDSDELKKFLSPILLVLYFAAFISIMLAVVCTLEVGVTLDVKTTILCAALVFLIWLFILCRTADKIDEMIEVIRQGVYVAEAAVNGKRISKASLMVSTRCSKNIKLSAYGLFPLSSESFGVLFKATFSALVTIIQLHQKK